MSSRLPGRCCLVVAVGVALSLSGCTGSSSPAGPTHAVTPSPTVTALPSAAGPCSGSVRLHAGQRIAAWQLAAMHMFTPRSGVAVTSPWLSCDVPLGPGRGVESHSQAQTVLLARTSDGGRHWVGTGAPAPVRSSTNVVVRLIPQGGDRMWLQVPGHLYTSPDGGRTWRQVTVPDNITDIGIVEGAVWIAACRPIGQTGSCTATVWRVPPGSSTPQRLPFPPTRSLVPPVLAPMGGTAEITELAGIRHGDPATLFATTLDAGQHWTVGRPPRGPGGFCRVEHPLITAAEGRWWLMCIGGAAAGSEAKAVLSSDDSGRTWVVRSAITDLGGPNPDAHGLGSGDVLDIAAGSRTRIWTVDVFGAQYSDDAGRDWANLRYNNPGGANGTLDVLDETHAWLLAPSRGLWATNDGHRWTRLGELHPA